MKPLIVTLLTLLLPAALFSQNPEITEENYLRRDSIIWAQYDRDAGPLFAEAEHHPDRMDSLKAVYDAINAAASRQNVELAIEYASVPSGFQRLFMVRLDIPKDRLRSVFEALPEDMRSSQTGRNIQAHLDTEQIEEGDRYFDFEATTDTGDEFRMSSLAGKNVLFLYGGMGCMGPDGREYLNALYERTSRNDLEIVMYCLYPDMTRFPNERVTFPCKYVLVSDFQLDSSPVKIVYGAQATPTCFFIDREGIVRMKSVGLDFGKVDELVVNK